MKKPHPSASAPSPTAVLTTIIPRKMLSFMVGSPMLDCGNRGRSGAFPPLPIVILVAPARRIGALVGMGQKYLPTIRDQKLAQRFQWQQRVRLQKEQPVVPPQPPAEPDRPAAPSAPVAAAKPTAPAKTAKPAAAGKASKPKAPAKARTPAKPKSKPRAPAKAKPAAAAKKPRTPRKRA